VHKNLQNFLEVIKILSGAEVRNWWCGTAIPVRGAEQASRCGCPPLVMNKCFLLNSEKIGADLSCRFRKKLTFNSEKWRHRADGYFNN